MLTKTNTLLLDGLRDPRNDPIWTEFHDRYRPILVAFARKLGFEGDDAEEVAQETLVRFARDYRAGRYERERGRLRSWIFAIARARAMSLRRASARRGAWRGPSALNDAATAPEMEAAWDAEWSRAVLLQAVAELRAMTRTDPRTVRAFEMLTFEERAPSDVAAALGMSVENVYVAKHRALDRLRGILARLEEEF